MGFFDPKHKGKLHVVQVVLVIAALALSGVRIVLAEFPMTRADTMALGMGAKSLIIIGYQVASEPGRWLRRFGSLKANFILNIIEVAAWGAVVYLVMTSTLRMCKGPLGTSCLLAWIIIGVAGNISMLSMIGVCISYNELRLRRKNRSGKGDFESLSDNNDMQALRPVYHYGPRQ